MSPESSTDFARPAATLWRAPTKSWLPALVLSLVVLLLWEAVVRVFSVSAFIVPAPSAIAAALVREWGSLADAALVTAREILVGFVASAAVGVGLALLIVRFGWLGRAFYPLIVLFQNVPKVALAPIFILWFGYGLAPKVGLIMVIAFFPVTLSMLAGMELVDPSLLALMRSVGTGATDILFKISRSAFPAQPNGRFEDRRHIQRHRRHRG